jgi:CHAT domain-containing protein
VVGLTRAFVYAGAPSIVSSLWKVDDVATAVTVKRLFRNLAQGVGRAEALHRAQLDVKRLVNAHPAYWASMTLAGAWR